MLELTVHASRQTIAATTGGRYFLRVADQSKPLMPDDLPRLFSEKDAYVWETQTTRRLPRTAADPEKEAAFLAAIRASERVSGFSKAKPDDELLEHYLMVKDDLLTNLGILWIGRREDRAQLLHAPVIQFIKRDHRGEKVNKIVWQDYSLNPMELIEAVWREIPDWREITEVEDGLFRRNIPHYDEVVVRELLANALVHRPYTTRGDIFINLHPDHVEFHNPGLLPIGVTPQNILHASTKRNPHLARIFYDLKLMEGEGSGYDRIYESLLMMSKPLPQVREEDDRVVITIERRVVRRDILQFLTRVEDSGELTQRERISLGLIAQHQSLTALEFSRLLALQGEEARLRSWLDGLIERGVIETRGRTRGTAYSVTARALRTFGLGRATTLRLIPPHRLRALILEDLSSWPDSSISQIHHRIGSEIRRSTLSTALDQLLGTKAITRSGTKRGTRCRLAPDFDPQSPNPA